MEIIFKILCGILYLIGLLFDCSYKEISVYICIYAVPIICIISTLILNGMIVYKIVKKCTIFRLFLLIISYMYISLYLNIFAHICKHYQIGYNTITQIFDQCMFDLLNISKICNISYEECNIYIYVYLFLGILGINSLITYLIKKIN